MTQIDQIPTVACTQRPKPSEDVPWWGWVIMSPLLIPIGALLMVGMGLFAVFYTLTFPLYRAHAKWWYGHAPPFRIWRGGNYASAGSPHRCRSSASRCQCDLFDFTSHEVHECQHGWKWRCQA